MFFRYVFTMGRSCFRWRVPPAPSLPRAVWVHGERCKNSPFISRRESNQSLLKSFTRARNPYDVGREYGRKGKTKESPTRKYQQRNESAELRAHLSSTSRGVRNDRAWARLPTGLATHCRLGSFRREREHALTRRDRLRGRMVQPAPGKQTLLLPRFSPIRSPSGERAPPPQSLRFPAACGRPSRLIGCCSRGGDLRPTRRAPPL